MPIPGSPSSIAHLQVGELMDAIGSKQISPGAGVAGAVTLALAAACAAKAVAISMKHRPDHAGLRRSLEELQTTARFALEDADHDSEAFAAFIKIHSSRTIAQLIREGDQLARLIDVLSHVLREIEPQIEPNMSGDMMAAHVLMDAARTIQLTNSAQAHEENATLGSQPRIAP